MKYLGLLSKYHCIHYHHLIISLHHGTAKVLLQAFEELFLSLPQVNSLPADKLQEIQKAIELFSVGQGPAKTMEEATRRSYQFWDTQPVPKLGIDRLCNCTHSSFIIIYLFLDLTSVFFFLGVYILICTTYVFLTLMTCGTVYSESVVCLFVRLFVCRRDCDVTWLD